MIRDQPCRVGKRLAILQEIIVVDRIRVIGDLVVIFVDLVVEICDAEAERQRRDAFGGKRNVVGAIEQVLLRSGVGNYFKPQRFDAFLQQVIDARAAVADDGNMLRGVVAGVVNVQVKNDLIERNERVFSVVLAAQQAGSSPVTARNWIERLRRSGKRTSPPQSAQRCPSRCRGCR